jgi:hypothetical protein
MECIIHSKYVICLISHSGFPWSTRVVELAFANFLWPTMKNEIKNQLTLEAKEAMVAVCAQAMRSWINITPCKADNSFKELEDNESTTLPYVRSTEPASWICLTLHLHQPTTPLLPMRFWWYQTEKSETRCAFFRYSKTKKVYSSKNEMLKWDLIWSFIELYIWKLGKCICDQ